MGRHPGVAAAFRAVLCARLQDRDDAALRAGCDLARCRLATRAHSQQWRKALHPALCPDLAAAGRYRRGERGGAAPRQCTEPGDRRRSCRPRRERREVASRACRVAAGASDRPGRPDELPEHALSAASADRGEQCRCHPRARAHRLLGDGERLHRQWRARHRHQHEQGKTRDEAHQHQRLGVADQGELPGLPALPGGRRGDGGGRRSDPAGVDRGSKGGNPCRSQSRHREARRGREESLCRAARARQAGGGARLGMELWTQIKDLDWSLVSSSGNVSNWPNRLWPMEKHYRWLGRSGGYGVGYGAPASVGAALANRDLGRFSVNIQSDGDLMYAPGVLWTAARHNIPQLAVMFNNRGYHQEVMHVQRLSNFRNRVANLGNDMGPIGTSIQNPDIEYHKLAESMGWWAKGPIKDPAQLGPALKEAVAVVKSGQPALLNVWTQPR